jgi:hypothetical protein
VCFSFIRMKYSFHSFLLHANIFICIRRETPPWHLIPPLICTPILRIVFLKGIMRLIVVRYFCHLILTSNITVKLIHNKGNYTCMYKNSCRSTWDHALSNQYWSSKTYFIFFVKMTQMSKWRHALTFPSSHPMTQKVNVMATFTQQGRWTLAFFVPISSHVTVGKKPEPNLHTQERQLESNVLYLREMT